MFARLYWILPIISALVWLATLLALLLTWITQGRPIYPSMDNGQTIAYISDVGAERLKPLFIAGSTIMVVCLDLSMIAERWLRHLGRLAPNTSKIQIALSIIAIIGGLAGGAGLILLSVFDTLRHPTLHDDFLALFIVGYVVSAIFICAEYQRLGIHFRKHPVLRASFWVKLIFILLGIGLALGFGICNTKKYWNDAAIVEWSLAFFFTLFILSFAMDLLPAVRTSQRGDHAAVAELEKGQLTNGHTNGISENGYQGDEQRQTPARAYI